MCECGGGDVCVWLEGMCECGGRGNRVCGVGLCVIIIGNG